MKNDIGVPAEISSPAKSRVCPSLKMAIPLAISIVLATPNEAKAAVTVIPGTSNSTMSAPTARIFSQYGPGQDELAEERSNTPGMSDMFVGSSIIDCYHAVVDMYISEEDGVAGGTLFMPWHLSLNSQPSDTDLLITAKAVLMCRVDGAAGITLSEIGKSMQIGFSDGPQEIDIEAESANYFIELSPGPHHIKVITFITSERTGSNVKSMVQPEFTPNVPEPSSALLSIGGAVVLLAGGRRRNSNMTA